MLDEVLVLGLLADNALAAPVLGAVLTDGTALHVAGMGDRNNATLVRDQVLHVDFALVGDNLGTARRAVLLLDLRQLLRDDCQNLLFALDDAVELFDPLNELEIFVLDLFALEA